jgi:hypothetical protein
LVNQGRELAKKDADVNAAIAKFYQALKLDPSLSLDPRAEVKQLAVSTLIRQGRNLVYILSSSSPEVDVAGAVAKFQKAKELDPSLELDPDIEAKQLAVIAILNHLQINRASLIVIKLVLIQFFLPNSHTYIA